jgi:BlaI family transcriptional regulator, penicillinase repressor
MPEFRISDAEWEVMQVVWTLRTATAADVIERLTPQTGWSHRTVRTLLSRLVQKGVLAADEEGHRNRYRAVASRKRCVRQAGQSFLEKIFEGDPAELLVHFVQNSNISAEQIEQLKLLLDQKLQDQE